MFNFDDTVITKVANPLKVTKSSLIEFNIGRFKDTGLYRFKKIIEFNVSGKIYARYLIYSNVEEAERIFEVFPGNVGEMEAYVYELSDTVPFSEDFLDVAGQRFMNTPDGNEYTRCIMPENEDRLDGLWGKVRVFNMEINEIEKEYKVRLWDYRREYEGGEEFLNIEMSDENGMFRIFIGERIESIFYNFHQTSKGK